MKQCKECGVKPRYSTVNKCRKCHNQHMKQYRSKMEDKNKYNNTDASKKAKLKYQKTKKWEVVFKKYQGKISAGIYGIFNDCKLIYIGESLLPKQRSIAHFSKRQDLKQAKIQSNVSYALSIGELQRDKLRFKMLEFIDDTPTRKQREECLIQRYKPLYN